MKPPVAARTSLGIVSELAGAPLIELPGQSQYTRWRESFCRETLPWAKAVRLTSEAIKTAASFFFISPIPSEIICDGRSTSLLHRRPRVLRSKVRARESLRPLHVHQEQQW